MGGFELNIQWKNGEIINTRVLSRAGERCRIDPGKNVAVSNNGKKVRFKTLEDGSIEFITKKDQIYSLSKKK